MSMFMAAMALELRETGELKGLSGMSAAGWKGEIREYEERLERDRHNALSLPSTLEGGE